ncbi:ATP phosphoribosyltransferase regulatory subunit [Coriobacteriia bacterium Es71-Z0120]|uniref:ATP phosphoribosyltransferase regulatory subunit n=1 Tax=Parvivirga hydrogeniphila TaxID=2939460 RepID=UPI002260EF01|nr:ATP phosphoribosyltransferase regulatory subunit [Parvivirga hydrogeniphila]MCL4078721.1 ATP phosphoribosyltransferase regulatory subunit [Parvivirga hydrogeniphila]
MRPATPRGFRDVLRDEAAEREAVAAALVAVFDAWGYAPVETPVVESYEVVSAAGPESGEAEPFRLLDSDGELLALRPDMTLPIARVAATRLADDPEPLRVRYLAPVFREHASFRGQARQFTQAGVELIGATGPAADAEIVALAAEALRAAGLAGFTIAIGSVEVLRALVDAAGMPDPWGTAVLRAAHARNLPEVQRLASEPGVPAEVGDAFVRVLRTRGASAAIEECRDALAVCGRPEAADGVRETYGILDELGYSDEVVVDFGTVRSFGYYTGMVMQVYAPGLGLPVGGGGRYDRLLASFDRPAPAAGFAIGLERLTIALSEAGATPKARRVDAVVGGADATACFAGAAALREAGWRVRLACGISGLDLVRAAERTDAFEAIEASGGALYRLDRAGGRADALPEPPGPPPSERFSGRRRP